MQMHQIRYFLALCEERNFTRAAKRCGVSQPSLTNAIIALERELGGTLFQRRPFIALTVLGHAIHPYLDRIAQKDREVRMILEHARSLFVRFRLVTQYSSTYLRFPCPQAGRGKNRVFATPFRHAVPSH